MDSDERPRESEFPASITQQFRKTNFALRRNPSAISADNSAKKFLVVIAGNTMLFGLIVHCKIVLAELLQK